MNRRPIRPNLDIADQPTEEELRALKREGYSAVVNLRRTGEPDQPLDPKAERDCAQDVGLEYLHVPVGGEPLDTPQVEAISEFLDRHADGKVLLHCKQGGRAAALALLHIARIEGWKANEVVEKARTLGLELPPPVRAMVEDYLAR